MEKYFPICFLFYMRTLWLDLQIELIKPTCLLHRLPASNPNLTFLMPYLDSANTESKSNIALSSCVRTLAS